MKHQVNRFSSVIDQHSLTTAWQRAYLGRWRRNCTSVWLGVSRAGWTVARLPTRRRFAHAFVRVRSVVPGLNSALPGDPAFGEARD